MCDFGGAVLTSIGHGCRAHDLFEYLGKIALVGKVDIDRDLREGEPGIEQQLRGTLDANFCDSVLKACAGLPAEQARKIAWADAQGFGHVLQADGFAVVLSDVIPRAGHVGGTHRP